jgi:rRNA-processing protein FCF1
MTVPITETVKIELENLVDAHGLTAILETLAEIASEKAVHIAVNWQDQKTAVLWERAASRIGTAATATEDYIGR